ncbi:GNAT family N-acetyltransferase [Fluviibacterium sp. DFM31]|uniref:GNAT family N-acetyltransferase n=1 Tax=Meridianimarinicoccus marinus TaxID=3231483 RepID=A0ABV3LB68_9RHOB
MSLQVRVLTGEALLAALEDLAGLRISVFREFPYLYDGDLDYERRYMRSYADSATAILVGAFAGERLVGAATGTMMADHAGQFATPLKAAGLDIDECFYCAESVLLPAYRGQGAGHRFFDLREDHGRRLGAKWSVFCAVQRPADHPRRPPDYRPHDAFWRKRGYAPLDGAIARFSWRDLDEVAQSEKPLQVWARPL